MLTKWNFPDKDQYNWTVSPTTGVLLVNAVTDSNGDPIDITKKYWMGKHKDTSMIVLLPAGPSEPVNPLQAAMLGATAKMFSNGYYGAYNPVPMTVTKDMILRSDNLN